MIKFLQRLTGLFAGTAHPESAPETGASEPMPSPLASAVVPAPDVVAELSPPPAAVSPVAGPVIVRQAVFNRRMQVAGYAFGAGGTAFSTEYDHAVVDYATSAPVRELLGERSAFVEISEQMLFDPRIRSMRQPAIIPLIHFAPEIDDLPLKSGLMATLRQQGVALALADGRLALQHPELAGVASVAFFSVADYSPPDLLHLARQLRRDYPLMQLGVRELKLHEEFAVCRRLGFKYFQGEFLTEREDWSQNEADPGTLGICHLLERMRQGADLVEIAELIKLDPLLSYRILRFANSAAVASGREVISVRDAVVIVGEDFLYRWVVLAMCAMAPAEPGHQALLEAALLRGRLMELLAGLSPSESEDAAATPDICFMTGMFSLLDVMLKIDIGNLLERIKLPAAAHDAILERRGPCVRLLQLAEACEKADQEQILSVCQLLGIDAPTLNRLHLEAAQWAHATALASFG